MSARAAVDQMSARTPASARSVSSSVVKISARGRPMTTLQPGTDLAPASMPMPQPGSGRHQGSARGQPGSGRQQGSARQPASNRGTSEPLHREFRPNHTYFPEVGNFTLTAIPGYGGHIPGKVAENVISSTFNRSNQLAAVQCEERLIDDHTYTQQPRNVPFHNPYGVTLPHRRGTDIPGYTAFVPGKYADGVFGHVFARANNISQLLKQRQYSDRVEWLAKLYN